MRLWHYKLIPFLPNSQLIAQWRELNSIFKKQDNHILINYVYEYPKNHLLSYADEVWAELKYRGYKICKMENYDNFYNTVRKESEWLPEVVRNPFPNHHTNRYLLQCFYNLQEKYDRGQKDFSKEQYNKLEGFLLSELAKIYGCKPEVIKL